LAENPFLWDITAASNDDADPAVPWPEGMFPGAVNNSARAIMAGVARLIKDLNGTITTSGSLNVYEVTTASNHSTLTSGILITAKASFTNTAASYLNMNGYGAKKIRTFINGNEADLGAGQIISAGSYQFKYDAALDSASGGFLILNPSPDPALVISTGTIKIWPSDTLESGWLWCNGAAVSRSTYSALFTAIGTTYGAGDASTTFNLPNYKGRSPFGSGDMGGTTDAALITSAVSGFDGTTLGATGGVESITLLTAQIPSHSHTAHSSSVSASGTSGTQSADHTHTGTTGTQSHNHTHGGTTGTQSVDHTHTGTSGNQSANHTHATTISDGVLVLDSSGSLAVSTSAGNTVRFSKSYTSGNESANHTHTTTTGGVSANHTHDFTTSLVSDDHAHGFTSNGVSADHTHSVTVTGTAAAQTIDSAGGDGAHRNMPPAIIQNFCIKT
jgi:microcystin-dependent protein